MTMIDRTHHGLVILSLVTFTTFLVSCSDYDILRCDQGSAWNDSSERCQKCPNGTYWAMTVQNETVITAIYCAGCPRWFQSPEGSHDITMCVCNDVRCEPEAPKETNLPMIVGIIGTLFGIGIIIAGLAWCKTYGPEFLKMFSVRLGDHHELESTEADDSLLQRSPSPNLLDLEINVTDEQIDDEYNDITKEGDINDMQAVLRAAVISEKRRSRVYSMSSMTDLSERYRTTSACESIGGRSGIEKAEARNRDVHLPLPTYHAVTGRHAQTNL